MGLLDTLKNTFNKVKDSGLIGFNTWGASTKTPTVTPAPTPTPTMGKATAPIASTPMPTNTGTTFGPAPIPKADTRPLAVSSLNQQPIEVPTPSTPELKFTSYFTGEKTDKSPRDEGIGMLAGLIKEQGTKGEFTAQAQEEVKLAEQRQLLNEINTRATQRQRQLEKEIEALRKNPEGMFGPNALNAQISEKTRLANQELADLAIQQQAALGNVNTAIQIVNDKVSAKFDPIKEQIDGMKSFLTIYGDDLTTREKMELESSIRMQESGLENEINNTKIQEGSNAYAQMIQSGIMELKDVPKEYQPSVSTILSSSGYISPAEKSKADKAQNTLSVVNDLLTGKLGLEVGPGWQRTLGSVASFAGFGGGIETRKAKIAQLKSLLTFENLSQLKGLGAMSDREFATIQAAAAALNESMSESEFKKVLRDLSTTLTDKLIASPAIDTDTKETLLIQKLTIENPKLSPEKIAEMAEQILSTETSFNSVGNTTASNRPQRNNNPLNIKASKFTSNFEGVQGTDPTPASDGGRFLVFNSPESGFNAAKRLLQAPSYSQLSVDSALKRWSNNGYGVEIAPQFANKKINQLSAPELDILIKMMAQREGYYA